ncbi:LOW QUALITY PROTEIN: hypothetical protein YC2023_006154 [Brassica napus]
MKQLAPTTRRGSDQIEAKEREAIEPRRTESIDQRNRRRTPERSRRRFREETRRGDKSRIAPSKGARATGSKSRLYSRSQYTGDRVTERKSATGIGASSHYLPRERYERENEKKREKLFHFFSHVGCFSSYTDSSNSSHPENNTKGSLKRNGSRAEPIRDLNKAKVS